jgi:cytochrome P450
MGVDLDFAALGKSGDVSGEIGKLRAAGRVVWSPALKGWLVAGYEDVKKTLLDTRNFTTEGTAVAESMGAQAMLVQHGEIHHVMRSIWAPTFMANPLQARRARMEDLAARTIDAMVGRLRAGETVDISEVLYAYVIDVLMMMLGMSRDRGAQIRRLTQVMSDRVHLNFAADHPVSRARHAAKADAYALLAEELERQRDMASGNPAEDSLVSLMAAAEREGKLSRTAVLDNLFNVLAGGTDTTVSWLGSTIVCLHRYPTVFQDIRADWSVLPKVMEEAMRMQSVVQMLVRIALTSDAEVGGTRIAKGDSVHLFTGAANRDPAAFDHPDTFDYRRPQKLNFGFSYGMHVCIGINLARLQAQILLRRLLEKFAKLEVVDVAYDGNWVLRGLRSLTVRGFA